MGGGLATTFEGQVAPALTDGISTSTHFSAGEVPLSFAGDFDPIPPDMGGATVMGYKHILGDAEREAGCIAWGDGKNFDPTSATTMIYPKGSKSLSTKEISDIVANAGPNTDLSKYGIEKPDRPIWSTSNIVLFKNSGFCEISRHKLIAINGIKNIHKLNFLIWVISFIIFF